MACGGRAIMIAYVLVLVVAFSAVDAMDIFSKFDGMFDDPFMLMFQNQSTCGHLRVATMMRDTTRPADDDTEREIVAGEYPWQVALYHGEMKLCSAVLIHEQWILTSASCVPYLMETYMVVAGTLSLLHSDDDVDGSQHAQRRMTTEIYVHPKYDARRMESDIALVKVELPFELNDYVNVICLPHPKMHRDFRPGTRAGIAGWGHLPLSTERPGMCPKPTGDILDECDVEVCEMDNECSAGEKCCRNGCGIMTCMEARPSGPGPRPGVLRGGVTPLINHTACNETMMGALPKGVICAGVTPHKLGVGGMEMMEDGGIVALLKWKRKMKEMARGTGNDRDDDGNGLSRDVDLMQTMSLLMEHIDGFDGSVDAYRRRQSGAWSIGKMDGVIRSGKLDDDDDDDEMEDAWMKEGMAGQIDDVEGMWMDEGMEGGMEEMTEDKMTEDMMALKEKTMMMMMEKNCKGDRGSPLVAKLKGQWYVLGVTTLPRGCLFEASPGLFAHLFNLREWIRPIFNGKEPERKSKMCGIGEFSCGDGWCIPEEYRCDGRKDCLLGTDEGPFCEEAMKGFNVYLDHHLNRSTVARAFPVRSFAQCAQACLKEPYLCPGFDAVLVPVQSDSPPIVPRHATDDDDIGDKGKEVRYDVEDERGDDMPVMMDGMMIMCLLANSTSVVGSNADVVPISRLKMAMTGKMPLAKPIHLHFKLPRHAPLAAFFSPTMNLYLPTGLIVSPSYILGHDLATLLEDKSFVFRFIKKLLVEGLVDVSHISCLMSHQHWDIVREMEKNVKRMREEAKNVLTMMEDEGGEEDGVMGGYLRRIGEMKMQLKMMERNFTVVMGGMKRDCDVMSIKRGLMLRLGKMMGNASCKTMSKDRDMVGGEFRDMEGENNQEKLTGVMMMLMKMMEELEEVMPDLQMTNMYPEGDGMMVMGMSTGDKMMMGRGSMMGDSWGMLGNDDTMSTFLTDMTEMMIEMMDSESNEQSLNSSMMMMIREILAISSALAMDRCNHGNVTSGDALGDLMYYMNDVMEPENMTEVSAFAMMRMKELKKRVEVGHQKWSIAQSPRQVNNVNFRILDVRGPMRGGNNMDAEFGMILARGFGGVSMETNIVSHMIRRMAIEGQKLKGRDREMVEEDMEGMSDGIQPPLTEEESVAMDWTTKGDDTATMGGVLPGNMDEDIFWKVVESMAETAVNSGMDDSPGVIRLIEAFRRGDIDKETFIDGVGQGLFRRTYASVMMKLKMLDARGRVYHMTDLYRGKPFNVDGSVVDIEQFTTNESNHGIILEYKSGWSCDQKITKTMGVLTSPNFPKAYPINVRCNSFISAPPGYVVVLYVLRFKLQWSPYCLHDSLTIYDETTPRNWTKLGQGSFCGTIVPHVFRSSGQNLLVKFMSSPDHVQNRDSGFKIIYAFQSVVRAMTDQAGRSSSNSSPEITGVDAQTKLDAMKEKLMCLKISLGVISGVLLLVTIVSLVWIYYHAKNRREKAKEVYDTKL